MTVSIGNNVMVNHRVLELEAEIHQLGWDLPDYLFATIGHQLNVELWMEVPGRSGTFMKALADLGLRAGPDVYGLLLVLTYNPGSPVRPLLDLPVMGGLKRICRQSGVRQEALMAQIATEPPPVIPRQPGPPQRALMAVLRDGSTCTVVRHEGGQPLLVDQLPEVLGDHEAIVGMAVKLLDGVSPLRRGRLVRRWPVR